MVLELLNLHLDCESAAQVGHEALLGVCGPGSIQMPEDDNGCNDEDCGHNNVSVSKGGTSNV